MLKEEVNQLISQQLIVWPLARDNYRTLEQVKYKTLDVNGRLYKVQFNPARITSSAAKVDLESISQRNCFLCSANRPAEQKGIPFKDRYTILLNPYPVFPRHFTIPLNEHAPQLIASRFGDMLDLAKLLDDDIVFYNGPKCGASAPNHFHFQAGSKGLLPIEKDRNRSHALCIESDNRQDMLLRFEQIYDSLPLQPHHAEPMMNVIMWYENGVWTTFLFPRKKHRPECFYAEGEENMLISPAAVDMAGVFITPMEKDFEKITAKNIVDIVNELCL
jgi:hypothetical protein